MSLLSQKDTKRLTIAPGIDLVHNLTLSEARALFGRRILDINEMHKFANRYPKVFLSIIYEMNLLSKTLAVVSDLPLGSFVQNGNLVVQSEYNSEKRQLIIPAYALDKAGIDLNKKKPLLLINDGYVIHQERCNVFIVTINPAYIHTMNRFLKLFTKPKGNGWYKEISGMPASEASTYIDKNAIYYWTGSQFGPVSRGYYDLYGNLKRDGGVSVSNLFGEQRGALINATNAHM